MQIHSNIKPYYYAPTKKSIKGATLGIAVIAIATASNVEAQPIYDVCMHKDGGNFSIQTAKSKCSLNSKANATKPTSTSSTDLSNFGVKDRFDQKFVPGCGSKKAMTG